MAAERFSSDVLEMFYSPIPRRENIKLPEPLNGEELLLDEFELGWLREWRMNISEGNPHKRDLDMFKIEKR